MNRYQELMELQQNWTPPPELARSGSREVALTGTGRAVAILAGAFMVGALAAGIALQRVSANQSEENTLLTERGMDVTATITRLWRTRDKDSRPMVTYQYTVGGRIYGKSVGAPGQIWKGLKEGETLQIRYLPFQPRTSHPTGWDASQLPLWVPIFVAAMLAGAGGFLTFMLLRAMRLLSEGRPALGVVIRQARSSHNKKIIYYEFPLLNGGIGKGKRGPAHRAIEVGEPLCVVYDRENPRFNVPYPMDMVRVRQP